MTSRLPLLAAAATGVQVGAAMVATRFVVAEIGPFSLAFLRYAIGALCLLPALAMARQRPRFAWRDAPPIALLGVAQFGLLIALLNIGLARVPAGQGAVLFAIFPLLTLLIASALGREDFTARKLGGVLLTLAGVALTLGAGNSRLEGTADLAGYLAVLAAALCGALCSVLYRPYLQRYPTLPVSALAMLASVAALAVPAASEGLLQALPVLRAGAWTAVLFIGMSSGLGYVLWLWALGRAAPTQVTVFLSLSPVTAVLFGGLLLGEPLSAAMVPGMGCLVMGFWLTSR